MKTLKFKKITAGVALAISSTFLQAAPLDLDTSFDGDGIASANYGLGSNSFFTDVEITPDDRVVALGHAQKINGKYDLLLVKYLLDGTLDNSFGINGKVNLSVEDDARGESLAILPDGKLLVIGHSKGAANNWKLYVKRFNTDGSEDLSFTEYTYSPSIAGQVKGVYAKDLALTSSGKILISIQQFNTAGAGGSSLNRSRMLRLLGDGSLDTTFGTNGFTDRSSTSYSYENNKFALDGSGDIYISGRSRYAPFSDTRETMTVAKYNANGSAQNFGGSVDGWARRGITTTLGGQVPRSEDVMFSSMVLPNGNIVSAGCSDFSDLGGSRSSSRSRIQVQNSAGVFQNTFSTDGVYLEDTTPFVVGANLFSDHCYRDVTYHPGVGIIAVGGLGYVFSGTIGKLYASAVDATTGASLQPAVLLGSFSDSGSLLATAVTASGKIVSVGHQGSPRESVIVMMEGAALPTPTSTLNPISFTDNTDVAFSTQQTAAANSNVVITPSAALAARVFSGNAIVNNLPVTSPFSLSDGDVLSLEHISAATQNTEVATNIVVNSGTGYHRNNQMWKVGDSISTFNSTTFSIDTTPDAFTFTAVSGATRSTSYTSAGTGISGINSPAAISVSAGSYYCINSDPCTNTSGTVVDGDVVALRHTSASGFSSDASNTVTIGGVSATFTSTTEAQDTTPNAFSFTPKTAAEISTIQVAADITVAGTNSAAPISISGGSYRINSGAYTSSAGTVNLGDTVTVRHTSSSNFSTAVTNTLTIGGVSADFVSTTEAQDTTPDSFTLQPSSGTTGANLASVRYSRITTVAGINSAAAISIANGSYSVNGGAYISSNGTVNNGDVVRVRHTTSSSFSSTMTSTLTIGGVTGDFISTTAAQDTTPDIFSFAPRFNASLNASVQAGLGFAVSGINDATPISITGGQYRIGSGAFTSANGMVNNGDVIAVRHTASSSYNSTVTSSLTIGGVTGHYVSTTVAQDTTPNAFSFTDASGVLRNTAVEFASFDVLGITGAVAISVTNGEYKIGNGTYTSANGTVSNGDEVTVRHTNNSGFGVTNQSSLTIGTVTENFRSTTETADNTPDTFTFANQAGVELSTELTSDAITISGINTEAQVTISTGEYSINGGAFTSDAGIVENGDEVEVRHTSAASNEAATVTELTIGGVVGEFTTTTKAAVTATSSGGSSGGGGSMGVAFLMLSGLLFWRRRNK